jgi:hypothetical protein
VQQSLLSHVGAHTLVSQLDAQQHQHRHQGNIQQS